MFKCEFGIDTKDSDAIYEITWYQGNQLISTSQTSSLSDGIRTATLSNKPKKVFNLGTTVSVFNILLVLRFCLLVISTLSDYCHSEAVWNVGS